MKLLTAHNNNVVNVVALTGNTTVDFFAFKHESDAYDKQHPVRDVPEDRSLEVYYTTHKIEGLIQGGQVQWDIPDDAYDKDKVLTERIHDAFRSDAAVVDYFGNQVFAHADNVDAVFERARNVVGVALNERAEFIDFSHIDSHITHLATVFDLNRRDLQDLVVAQEELEKQQGRYKVIVIVKQPFFTIWNGTNDLPAESERRIYVTMNIMQRL